MGNAILLGSFVLVVVIQMVHRTAGAAAALVWCLGLGAYGYWMLESGADVSFLGVRANLVHLLAFVAVMAAYNAWVLARGLRARRR